MAEILYSTFFSDGKVLNVSSLQTVIFYKVFDFFMLQFGFKSK